MNVGCWMYRNVKRQKIGIGWNDNCRWHIICNTCAVPKWSHCCLLLHFSKLTFFLLKTIYIFRVKCVTKSKWNQCLLPIHRNRNHYKMICKVEKCHGPLICKHINLIDLMKWENNNAKNGPATDNSILYSKFESMRLNGRMQWMTANWNKSELPLE